MIKSVFKKPAVKRQVKNKLALAIIYCGLALYNTPVFWPSEQCLGIIQNWVNSRGKNNSFSILKARYTHNYMVN